MKFLTFCFILSYVSYGNNLQTKKTFDCRYISGLALKCRFCEPKGYCGYGTNGEENTGTLAECPAGTTMCGVRIMGKSFKNKYD